MFKNRKFLVFVLLAWIGEINAAPGLPCKMDSTKTQATEIDHSKMHHQMASSSSDVKSSQQAILMASDIRNDMYSNMDCCNTGYTCSMHHCVGVALINEFIHYNFNPQNIPIELPYYKAVVQRPTALFRPPIFG